MALARNRIKIVTGDASTNQTGWNILKKGGVVTISAPGAISATITLQRRGADGVIVDVTNNSAVTSVFTAVGTYTLDPAMVPGEYRLNMKSGAYVSGQPISMMLEAH